MSPSMRKSPTNAQIAAGLNWCIAGGWAACPQLASDQDVWIFVPIDSSDVDDRIEVLTTVRQSILAANPDIEVEESALLDDQLQAYGDLGFFVQKVGTLDTRHFMVTDAGGVSGLLSSFDISTHQCAVTSEGQFVTGSYWTPITEPPVKLRETEHTEACYAKIAERYRGLVRV